MATQRGWWRTRTALGALATTLAAAACGGSGGTADSAGTATNTSATADSAAAPAAGGAAAGQTAAAAPVTGKMVDVKMLGDEKGYRFEPANITIRPGDGVRWTVVSGPPHNVSFWADSIPAGSAAALQANMPNTTADLVGPLISAPNATYTISFAGAKPGVYGYYCTPHLALGMKAKITVQ